MRCEEMRGLIDLHLDRELPDEISGKLDRHLLRCPHCAYEIRTLEQTRAMLREAVPATETSPGFRERTTARLFDTLGDRLHSADGPKTDRQWTLPFARED